MEVLCPQIERYVIGKVEDSMCKILCTLKK